MNLSVRIGTASFENPVTVASGTFGYSDETCSLRELRSLGALIPKTVTLAPREGNPPPRIVETPAGMVNAIGIENAGIDAFIENTLPTLVQIGVPVIVSVMGNTDEEFVTLVQKCSAAAGIVAIELNLSCPNLQKKQLVSQDPESTARVVAAAKKVATVPVIAKLSPNVTDITVIAKAAEDAGADGVSVVNTFAAMVIDTNTRCSKLGNVTGGLSGPAIRPIAVYMVYRIAQVVRIPIIAMGGIMTADDALQFIIAGATMVAVGTASFIEPQAHVEVLAGIKAYLKKHGMDDVARLRGSLHIKK